MYLPNLQNKSWKNKLETNINHKQIWQADGGGSHVTVILPVLQFCLEPAHKHMGIQSLYLFCFANIIFCSALTELEIESHHKV